MSAYFSIKVLQVFDIDTQKIKFAHQLIPKIQILTCSVTCEEKTTLHVTLWKLTWHILLGVWYRDNILEENVEVTRFRSWKRHVTLWIWSWTSNKICQTCTYTMHVIISSIKAMFLLLNDRKGPLKSIIFDEGFPKNTHVNFSRSRCLDQKKSLFFPSQSLVMYVKWPRVAYSIL